MISVDDAVTAFHFIFLSLKSFLKQYELTLPLVPVSRTVPVPVLYYTWYLLLLILIVQTYCRAGPSSGMYCQSGSTTALSEGAVNIYSARTCCVRHAITPHVIT